MTAPFDYPSAPHVRRHGPRGYAGYESYRPWLRDEFSLRCVYCLTRETWTRLTGAYAIDHFTPVVARPDLAAEYDNLLYACSACNLVKGGRTVPDPLAVLLDPAVRVAEDGSIRADAPEAAKLIELLGLNRDRLDEFRELWIGIVRRARRFDPALYRRVMGYPDDLPNLASFAPPDGNGRETGIGESCAAGGRLERCLRPTDVDGPPPYSCSSGRRIGKIDFHPRPGTIGSYQIPDSRCPFLSPSLRRRSVKHLPSSSGSSSHTFRAS